MANTLASVNDGAWHFLVATYDGSGQAGGIQLYIDGSAASKNPGVEVHILKGGCRNRLSAP